MRACFAGFPLERLAPVNQGSARSLVRARSANAVLPVRSGEVELGALGGDGCVFYETRFRNEVFRARDSKAVIVSQGEWLWRPEPLVDRLEVSVSFALPQGAVVSTPWPQDDDGYHPSLDAFYRASYSTFGRFDQDRFRIGETLVTVARIGPRPSGDDVRRWLTSAIGTVASVGARFPVDRVHFVIAPAEDIDRAVAFGMVRRGGGVSVLLIPSAKATVPELEADWVAIHELSHLWLPRPNGQGRWLAEGIATYLQEVLRARCGLQSADVSWARVRDGLERGRRSGTGRVLSNESRHMNRTGAYYRVYWAGTAFALEADLRLRRESGGRMTLLRALALAQPRLSTFRELVSADQVLAVLDEVAGSSFLATLGAQYASSARFPKASGLDDPASASIRREIMARNPAACAVIGE